MILHIVTDEKFIDGAHELFEKASPGNNEFMIITKKQEFKYVKKLLLHELATINFLSKKFAQSLTNYDFIIVHGLFNDAYLQLLHNVDNTIKFVWIGWGADFYKYINSDLYLEKTFNLRLSLTINNRTSITQNIKNYIKRKIYLLDICDKEKSITMIDTVMKNKTSG